MVLEYSVLSNLQLDKSYKLLELTPELLKIIEEKKENLVIKAPSEDSDIVICSSNKTFQIRQRNHSNTVLLTTETTDGETPALRGYSSMSSVFEAHLATGEISIDGIPIYDGSDMVQHDEERNVTVDELKQRSAISDFEFDKVWFDLNGSSLNDVAIILSDDFITEVLQILILSIAAAELDYEELSLIETYNTVDTDSNLSIDIVETALRKFSTDIHEPFKLDRVKISRWYGLHSLRKYAIQRALSIDEFLIKWKSEIPPFFECPLEISLLNGSFITPILGKIKYISKDTLPKDINSRLKTLFKLQSTWDLEELIPFIQEYNQKNLKFESFIMKFAKKKKVGKKILITAR